MIEKLRLVWDKSSLFIVACLKVLAILVVMLIISIAIIATWEWLWEFFWNLSWWGMILFMVGLLLLLYVYGFILSVKDDRRRKERMAEIEAELSMKIDPPVSDGDIHFSMRRYGDSIGKK